MLLLWTERPQLLEREKPTHDWMIANRPWEKFNLELIYDNAPGDWTHYSEVFRETWNRACRSGGGMINVESDILPTWRAFDQVIECPEPICTVPYRILHFDTRPGEPGVYGATVERRVPGGWDAHFCEEGEQWAAYGDLGFVRWRAGAMKLLPPGWGLNTDDGMLNHLIFGASPPQMRGDFNCKLHLHWPGLENQHLFWDEGDFRHHPSARWAALERANANHLAKRPDLRPAP